MRLHDSRSSRRGFLGTLTAGSAFFTTTGLFADQLALTPSGRKVRSTRTGCPWTRTTT